MNIIVFWLDVCNSGGLFVCHSKIGPELLLITTRFTVNMSQITKNNNKIAPKDIQEPADESTFHCVIVSQ